MSKQVLNTSIAPSPPNAPEALKPAEREAIEKLLYNPTPAAKKLKAKFWHRYIPSALDDPDNISLATVVFYTQDNRIDPLWNKPGFKEWFLNKDEGRERLEYLFMMALETAEDILTGEGINPAAKVNMIKVIGELANKFPSKSGTEKFVDDEINKMSQDQLENYLERKGVKVKAT